MVPVIGVLFRERPPEPEPPEELPHVPQQVVGELTYAVDIQYNFDQLEATVNQLVDEMNARHTRESQR